MGGGDGSLLRHDEWSLDLLGNWVERATELTGAAPPDGEVHVYDSDRSQIGDGNVGKNHRGWLKMGKTSDVLTRLREMPGVEVHRPADDAEIKRVERILSLKFPADYKEVLKSVGWVSIGSDDIYGLGPDVQEATSVLENTSTEHVMAEPLMHHWLLPIMNDGMGNHYCLDTDRIKDGTCPVVFWQHDHPKGDEQKPRRVAASFTEWLNKLLDDLDE